MSGLFEWIFFDILKLITESLLRHQPFETPLKALTQSKDTNLCGVQQQPTWSPLLELSSYLCIM